MPLRVTEGIAIEAPSKAKVATAAAAIGGLVTPVMLNVPWIHQEQTEWCWAACSQMVAAFLGNANVKQCELANFLHGQTKCCDKPGSNACNQPCPYEGIGQVYGHLNVNCISQEGRVNGQVLLREFNANRPVEIGFLWYGGGGHVVVLHGVTDVGLIAVNHPLFGTGLVTYLYLAAAYGQGIWAYSFGDFRNL